CLHSYHHAPPLPRPGGRPPLRHAHPGQERHGVWLERQAAMPSWGVPFRNRTHAPTLDIGSAASRTSASGPRPSSMGGPAPLSEHEQRQLEQIEQALRADHPTFADAVHATDPRVHYKRRVMAAALGFLIGVGLLLAGVVINVIPIAVAGFVVMLA